MILTLSVIFFLKNEWTSISYNFNAFASSAEISKVIKGQEEKKINPIFHSYSKQTNQNLASITMTTLSEIPSNQPIDIELQIMPITDNTLFEKSAIPYEVKIEQRGKVIYEFVGFTEDNAGIISPEFLKGPAHVTISLLLLQSSSSFSPLKSLAPISNIGVMADKVSFSLNVK